MKVIIASDDNNIAVAKDFLDMTPGLIGQTITEIEIIKQELLALYEEVQE